MATGGEQAIGWRYDSRVVDAHFLAAGETLTVAFTIGLSDGTGTTQSTLNITLVGSNDVPTFSARGPSSVAENTAVVGAIPRPMPKATGSTTACKAAGRRALHDRPRHRRAVLRQRPDYEAPTDADRNNVYTVYVTASDSPTPTDIVGSTHRTIVDVAVLPVNDNAPRLGRPPKGDVAENSTLVTEA